MLLNDPVIYCCLNFSDFIDGFVDKNVADVTIDGNANAHHKDICSMLGEKGKSEVLLIQSLAVLKSILTPSTSRIGTDK